MDRADEGTADDVYATITYWTDPQDNYIVGKPGTIRVTDNSRSNVYRERKAVYQKGTGNMTELSMLIQGSTNAVWNMDFYENGNLKAIQYPAGAPSHNNKTDRFTIAYQYDPQVETYVTAISDAFGYSSAADYKYEFGQPNWTKDINGNYQVNEYDDFGRMVKIYGAYDTDEAGSPVCPPSLTFAYDVPVIKDDISVPVVPAGAVTRNKSASSNTCNGDIITTATFVDGMKRMVQTKKEADVLGVHGMTLSGKVVYDELGRMYQQGQPSFEAGENTAYTRQDSTEPRHPTIFAYDTLDRTTMVKTPDSKAPGSYAVTTTVYDFGVAPGTSTTVFRTTVIDPEGSLVAGANGRGTKISYKDVHDKIVAVVEYNKIDGAVNAITTTYAYDLLDQITQVKDTKGHTTAITYDRLGRRLSIENPDTGLTSYTYDANGNVTTKETANLLKGAKKINYVYDYNRLVTINYPDTVDVAYEYGTPAEAGRRQGNLAGRIKKVIDESGEEQRWYGNLGETTKELRRVNAFNNPVARTWYETQYIFDSFGRMTQMTYPDGEVLAYGYDNGGLLREAYGTKRGNKYVYVKSLSYDEFGQRKRIEYGNGVTTTYDYDLRTRRLSRLLSVLPAGKPGSRTIQDIAYEYDLVGNILGTNNTSAIPAGGEHGGPTEQRFTYDDLYQLRTAGGWHQAADNKKTTYTNSFTYDIIGNITQKVQVHNIVHGTDPLTDSSTQPRETNYTLRTPIGSGLYCCYRTI